MAMFDWTFFSFFFENCRFFFFLIFVFTVIRQRFNGPIHVQSIAFVSDENVTGIAG